MVPANEVRIGSVLRRSHSKPFRVSLDDVVNPKFWQELSDMLPMPIDKETLIDAGFTMQQDGETYSIQVGNAVYLEYKDGNYSVVPETWRGEPCPIWRNLQHLHQLQNLYFALTGEELEIKLQP